MKATLPATRTIVKRRMPGCDPLWYKDAVIYELPEGNLYVAEVDAGRFQKFRPRAGANPAYLVGKPIYSAWQ